MCVFGGWRLRVRTTAELVFLLHIYEYTMYDVFHPLACANDQNVTWHLPICHYYKKFIAACERIRETIWFREQRTTLGCDLIRGAIYCNWILNWMDVGPSIVVVERCTGKKKNAILLICWSTRCGFTLRPSAYVTKNEKWFEFEMRKLRIKYSFPMHCHWLVANIN